MIPKKIHYCWLSGEKFPDLVKNCIRSWKIFSSEFEIILWDKNRFDINRTPYVKKACEQRKWAFAADYIRLFALYTQGGIYLDSDVLLKNSIDNYLTNDFVTSIEYHPKIYNNDEEEIKYKYKNLAQNQLLSVPGFGIQAAFLGSIPKHPFLKDCLNLYDKLDIKNTDSLFTDEMIAPKMLANVAIKYGFVYKDVEQRLQNNMLILPSKVIASTSKLETKSSIAIHFCQASWRNPNKQIGLKSKLIKFMRKFHLFYR